MDRKEWDYTDVLEVLPVNLLVDRWFEYKVRGTTHGEIQENCEGKWRHAPFTKEQRMVEEKKKWWDQEFALGNMT